MLEVVTALAAEEEHSTSPHSKAASSARDAQGTPTQSAAHSQRTASVQGTAVNQGSLRTQEANPFLKLNPIFKLKAKLKKLPNSSTSGPASCFWIYITYIELFKTIMSTFLHGLGLMLLGDLTIIWETAESSDDDFWKDQEEWEIIRWRFHESSGVHTLEIEDGTMIHMLAERRYPLSRELMIRMLDHAWKLKIEEIANT
ncbi:hypothetical protein Tco_0047138 [Tanacetum coccineum]